MLSKNILNFKSFSLHTPRPKLLVSQPINSNDQDGMFPFNMFVNLKILLIL